MKRRIPIFILLILCLSVFTTPVFAEDTSSDTTSDNEAHITIEFNEGTKKITMQTNGENDTAGSYANILKRYKNIAQVISGICTITALICFFFQVTKLGAAGDNQTARAAALKGILICGIVIAVFGSLEVFVSFFWNVLSSTTT